MAEDGARQRIAAILAADAVGYSRLMADDETATIAALDAARDVFREHIGAQAGRVVDTAGDSVLAVFQTTAGAVRAGLAIQQRLADADAEVPDARRMRFRIGIHLGDIHEKADGSVYGDGVNVAARLEALAEPGKVAVSDAVHATLRGRIAGGFADLGEHTVKNIPEPIRAYRALAAGESAPARPARDRRFALAGMALVLLATGALGLWRLLSPEPAPGIETAQAPEAPPALPAGPAIAVLPSATSR